MNAPLCELGFNDLCMYICKSEISFDIKLTILNEHNSSGYRNICTTKHLINKVHLIMAGLGNFHCLLNSLVVSIHSKYLL